MKISVKETDNEYRITKEKPYKDLINRDTLISVGFFFLVLVLVKLYILIPFIIFFAVLASLQTLEENYLLTINKNTKEFILSKYYMGIWEYKARKYRAIDFSTVQVEKQVTSMKDDGRFSIHLSTELPDSDKKGNILVVLQNLDLEDIEQAKMISYLLELIYDYRIKYKTQIDLK